MRYHFSGIAGAGMDPLARLMRARGHEVQGSDRSFDQGKNREMAGRPPASGSSVAAGRPGGHCRHRPFRVLRGRRGGHSGAAGGTRLGLELVPRPALLAEVVDAGAPGVAIAGTSGKSTVTGMVGWLLREGGVPATVLGGAELVGEGTSGCFLPGPAEGPVVAEACESDGTLGRLRAAHRPHPQHQPRPRRARRAAPQFAAFAKRSGRLLVDADLPEAAAARPSRSGRDLRPGPDADARLEVTSPGPDRARGALRRRRGRSPSTSRSPAATTSRTPPRPRWWRSSSASTPTPSRRCSRASRASPAASRWSGPPRASTSWTTTRTTARSFARP